MSAWKEQLFGVIATILVLLFVGVWTAVVIMTFRPPPDGLPESVVITAGTLATTMATITSAALGFTVAEVKAKNAPRGKAPAVTFKEVSAEVGWPTFLATLAYVVVGVVVLITWMITDEGSPELVATFAFSVLGWLAGGAGVAFRSPSRTGGER